MWGHCGQKNEPTVGPVTNVKCGACVGPKLWGPGGASFRGILWAHCEPTLSPSGSPHFGLGMGCPTGTSPPPNSLGAIRTPHCTSVRGPTLDSFYSCSGPTWGPNEHVCSIRILREIRMPRILRMLRKISMLRVLSKCLTPQKHVWFSKRRIFCISSHV